MKAFCKFIKKLLVVLAVIYGVLFAVFYWDLDGKLLYFFVEPWLVKRYDNMKRRDGTEIPYFRKDKLEPAEYTEIQ